MNVIKPAFSAVFPLLAFMTLGFFLRGKGLLDEKTAAGMNKLVFKVFLPLSIFQNVYKADLSSAFSLKPALYVAITCILSYAVLALTVGAKEKDKTIAPVLVQGIHKSNYNLLAFSIVSSFFGSETGMTAMLIIIVTPLTNICSTLAFESARGGSSSTPKMLKKIITNPMVLSSLLGLAVNMAGLKLPELIMSSVVSKLGAMATPAAMLALGAGFDFKAMKSWGKRLALVCTGKLVLMPLIIVAGAALLGIRGADLVAILVYSGAPTAVNSYSTAVSMGGNGELAGEIVALSSLLSVFTLFLFLTGLGAFGML